MKISIGESGVMLEATGNNKDLLAQAVNLYQQIAIPSEDDSARRELLRQKLELEVEELQLSNHKAQVDLQNFLGSPYARQTLVLDTEVEEGIVSTLIRDLESMQTLIPGCDITLDICSPGGDLFVGMSLFDRLRLASSRGHRIITIGSGYMASMGAILMQAGDVRRMTENSLIMFHELSDFVWGRAGEFRDRIEMHTKVEEKLNRICASRSRLSYEEFLELQGRKNLWLTAQEALEYGFIDEIVS